MKATVLMPVYNAEAYIKEAIESVLSQSFADFELLIINDGSTDHTENIIKQFASPKICYKAFEDNIGLIAALNYGIKESKTEYIIRMDADDISHPQRFARQIAFMDDNPEIAICGTWFSLLGSDELIRYPATDEECRINLLKRTVIGHPTAIVRRQAIADGDLAFRDWALHVEDYLFWAEACIKGLKIANIPEVLLDYRLHANQVSVKRRKEQDEHVSKVRQWYASQFFPNLINRDIDLYSDFMNGQICDFGEMQKVKILAADLKVQNNQHRFFDLEIFDRFIDKAFKEALCNLYSWKSDKLKTLLKTMTDLQFLTVTPTRIKIRYMLRSLKKEILGA